MRGQPNLYDLVFLRYRFSLKSSHFIHFLAKMAFFQLKFNSELLDFEKRNRMSQYWEQNEGSPNIVRPFVPEISIFLKIQPF